MLSVVKFINKREGLKSSSFVLCQPSRLKEKQEGNLRAVTLAGLAPSYLYLSRPANRFLHKQQRQKGEKMPEGGKQASQ